MDEESLPRLGFLAVTFGDGVCRIFDVPDPKALEGEENPIFGKSSKTLISCACKLTHKNSSSMPTPHF